MMEIVKVDSPSQLIGMAIRTLTLPDTPEDEHKAVSWAKEKGATILYRYNTSAMMNRRTKSKSNYVRWAIEAQGEKYE